MPSQAVLPFSPRVEEPPPYRPSASQVEGQERLDRLIESVGRGGGLSGIILRGPEGCGKSRLLEEFFGRSRHDFEVLVVADTPPMALFSAINQAAAAGQALIVEARGPIERWYDTSHDEIPSDLLSRLTALPEVKLESPSEEALCNALAADLSLHGLTLKAANVQSVASRLPRNFVTLRAFCRALEAAPPFSNAASRLKWAIERAQQGRS